MNDETYWEPDIYELCSQSWQISLFHCFASDSSLLSIASEVGDTNTAVLLNEYWLEKSIKCMFLRSEEELCTFLISTIACSIQTGTMCYL